MAVAAGRAAALALGVPGYAEEQLATFLKNLESNPLGWQAVHFHFSKLSPSHRTENALRIALVGLEPLERDHEGRLAMLFNGDVVLVLRGAQVSTVHEAVERTRALFAEDALSRRGEAFSTWYDLSIGNGRLQAVIRRLIIDKARVAETRLGGERSFATVEPLDPARLYKLQTALSGIDLEAYLRRQPVCALLPGRPPRPVLEEIYVRIADLQRPLMPNVNLAGNRWLFQHLTQSLDLRVLAILARRPEQFVRGPISLNLNIDTLLSQSFLAFDASLAPGQQRQIVLELQLADLFADIKAFRFGRDFVRAKGYRLCLDSLTPESLVLCDRERLGVDLLKLLWNPELGAAGGAAAVEGFLEAVAELGPERLIVAHCDDEEAVEFGRALGLRLFQGRHVDQLLNPGAVSRN